MIWLSEANQELIGGSSRRALVSLSHEEEYSVAYVTLIEMKNGI